MSSIVLIGCGAVGSSFLYSAMNQGLANKYGLIDAFENTAIGNVWDMEDAVPSLLRECTVEHVDYASLKDVDYIMIAAGRPQKPGETRLEMVKDNVQIIKEIAQKIKNSGFKGITFICANPVDVLTYAYIKYTGFDPKKVIGSGTVLDTARLRIAISKDLKVSPSSVESAYVIGEHGDSSVTVFSNIQIANKSICEYSCSFTKDNYEEKLERFIAKKAYTIIEKKRATFYGIGAAMARIVRAVIEDKNEIMVVGAYLKGEYGHSDVVFGVPAVINRSGISRVVEVSLNEKETDKLKKSCEIIKKINSDAVV